MSAEADPEIQAMGLVLTGQMLRQGAEARVLLCGQAGDLALKEVPTWASETITPRGDTLHDLLTMVQGGGAAIEVCAIYLPNRGLAPDSLADGVTAAKPPAIAALMVDPAVKVFGF